MDEVHYLGDRFRGAVWEEVIIHLPAAVRLVSLSATVSNAEEFGEWLVSVRGETTVIVHEERPVPLWQHMLVGSRLFDLFASTPTAAVEPRRVDPSCCATSPTARRYLEPMHGAHDRRRGRARGRGAGGRRTARTSSPGSTARGCCRRSPSSSAGPAATRRCASACRRACG